MRKLISLKIDETLLEALDIITKYGYPSVACGVVSRNVFIEDLIKNTIHQILNDTDKMLLDSATTKKQLLKLGIDHESFMAYDDVTVQEIIVNLNELKENSYQYKTKHDTLQSELKTLQQTYDETEQRYHNLTNELRVVESRIVKASQELADLKGKQANHNVDKRTKKTSPRKTAIPNVIELVKVGTHQPIKRIKLEKETLGLKEVEQLKEYVDALSGYELLHKDREDLSEWLLKRILETKKYSENGKEIVSTVMVKEVGKQSNAMKLKEKLEKERAKREKQRQEREKQIENNRRRLGETQAPTRTENNVAQIESGIVRIDTSVVFDKIDSNNQIIESHIAEDMGEIAIHYNIDEARHLYIDDESYEKYLKNLKQKTRFNIKENYNISIVALNELMEIMKMMIEDDDENFLKDKLTEEVVVLQELQDETGHYNQDAPRQCFKIKFELDVDNSQVSMDAIGFETNN